MRLPERLRPYLDCGQPIVVIRTDDPVGFFSDWATYTELKSDYVSAVWRFNAALASVNVEDKDFMTALQKVQSAMSKTVNAVEVIRNFHSFRPAVNDERTFTLFMQDFHLAFRQFLPDLASILPSLLYEIKQDSRRLVVTVPPSWVCPPELHGFVQYLDQPLPTMRELIELVSHILEYSGLEEKEQRIKTMANALRGLSKTQAELVIAYAVNRELTKIAALEILENENYSTDDEKASLEEQAEFKILDFLWKRKAEMLTQSHEGLFSLYEGNETFDDVTGFAGTKKFLRNILRPREGLHPDVEPKGIVLVGVPGTGKSLLPKALSNEVDMPMLVLNPGRLKGSLVGESEKRTEDFFRVAEAMQPCIIFVDEIMKVMPSGKGVNDGGASSNIFGTFLTKMNDCRGIFWVFTENDVSDAHEAFFRAERVDAQFYVGFPDDEQRGKLWEMYTTKLLDIPKEWFDLRHFELAINNGEVEDPHLIGQCILQAVPYGKDRKPVAKTLERLIPDFDATRLVHDRDWTGAEVKACCRLARLNECDLVEAAELVTPVKERLSDEYMLAMKNWAEKNALDIATATRVGRTSATTTTKKRRIVASTEE